MKVMPISVAQMSEELLLTPVCCVSQLMYCDDQRECTPSNIVTYTSNHESPVNVSELYFNLCNMTKSSYGLYFEQYTETPISDVANSLSSITLVSGSSSRDVSHG